MAFDLIRELKNVAIAGQALGGITEAIDQASFFSEFSKLELEMLKANREFMDATVNNPGFKDYDNLTKMYADHYKQRIQVIGEGTGNLMARRTFESQALQMLPQQEGALGSLAAQRRAQVALSDIEKTMEGFMLQGEPGKAFDVARGGLQAGLYDANSYSVITQGLSQKYMSQQIDAELKKIQENPQAKMQDFYNLMGQVSTGAFGTVKGNDGAVYTVAQRAQEEASRTVGAVAQQWYQKKEGQARADLQQTYGTLLSHFADAKQKGQETNMGMIEAALQSFERSEFPKVAEEAIEIRRSLILEKDRTAMSADQRKEAENLLANIQVKYEMGEINGNQALDMAKSLANDGRIEMKDVMDAVEFSSKPRMIERLPEVKLILDKYPDRNARAAIARAAWGLSKNGMDTAAVTTPAGLKSLEDSARLANERALKAAMDGRPVITEQDRQWNLMSNRENGRYIARNSELYKTVMRNPTGREQELNNLRMFAANTGTELSRNGMNATATGTFSDEAMPLFKVQPKGEPNKSGFLRPSYDVNGNRTWYFGTEERKTTNLIGNDEALRGWYGRTEAQRAGAAQSATNRTTQ